MIRVLPPIRRKATWMRWGKVSTIAEMVTHPDSYIAQRCLSSVFPRELMHSTFYRLWLKLNTLGPGIEPGTSYKRINHFSISTVHSVFRNSLLLPVFVYGIAMFPNVNPRGFAWLSRV